ncbi:MAG: hypothetical protein Q8N51_09445 [Gammaproteobacteria bacterium]|nr:hypothetical protein [Gammaproteobacteria bacterium]
MRLNAHVAHAMLFRVLLARYPPAIEAVVVATQELEPSMAALSLLDASTDLRLEPSVDGQTLLIYHAGAIVAMFGAMGGAPDIVELNDGRCYAIEDLLVMAESG